MHTVSTEIWQTESVCLLRHITGDWLSYSIWQLYIMVSWSVTGSLHLSYIACKIFRPICSVNSPNFCSVIVELKVWRYTRWLFKYLLFECEPIFWVIFSNLIEWKLHDAGVSLRLRDTFSRDVNIISAGGTVQYRTRYRTIYTVTIDKWRHKHEQALGTAL